jgi:hypothetical protein
MAQVAGDVMRAAPTTVGDIMGASCLIGRDDCRTRRMSASNINDLTQRAQRALVAAALSWTWVEADTPTVRLGVAGGWRDDDCRCLLEYALSLVDDLLKRPETVTESPPAVLAQAASVLSYALAADSGRLGLIQVASPQRPAWLPASAAGTAM